MSQPVEQRRLAGVRVTNERNRRDGLLVTTVPQLRTALAHLIDFALDGLDAHADAPAIRLELRFTWPPRADAAAKARQGGARSGQPRKEVLELSQFHLPAPLTSACTTREDVQNELRPVDHLALESLLELAQLSGSQFVIHDHDIHIGFRARRREARHLAGADERPGVRLGALLQHPKHHVGARRISEADKLFERLLGIHAAHGAGDETDERGTFHGRRPVSHIPVSYNPRRAGEADASIESASTSRIVRCLLYTSPSPRDS